MAGAKAISNSEDKDWTGTGTDTLQSAMEVFGVSGRDQAFKTLHYVKRAQQRDVENPNVWDAVVGSEHR